MKVYKIKDSAVIHFNGHFYKRACRDWDAFINRRGLFRLLEKEIEGVSPIENTELIDKAIMPIGNQEIWASGVTYKRSRTARKKESSKSGSSSFYDQVFDAERPELFYKASAFRAVGDKGTVRLRKDSNWNVPEPELTLFICSAGSIEGYTIGNDMSSRSIEGENPLYLPQAKTYDGCASIGPCIYVTDKPIDSQTKISMEISRKSHIVFSGEVAIRNMKRKHSELVDYLFRECTFPDGCFLMTGTGIVPPDDFTLERGDEIRIKIAPIGELINYVA